MSSIYFVKIKEIYYPEKYRYFDIKSYTLFPISLFDITVESKLHFLFCLSKVYTNVMPET